MLLPMVSFIFGNYFAQYFTRLLPMWVLLFLVCIWLTCKFIFRRQSKILNIVLALFVGFIWSAYAVYDAVSWELPRDRENKPVYVVGHVASIPVIKSQVITFQLRLSEIQQNHVSQLVQLHWRINSTNQLLTHSLRVGDQLQLLVTLKRVHGLRNPGSFNYESWALVHHLRASGRVIDHSRNRVVGHDWSFHPIEQLREKLYLEVMTILPNTTTSHWLIALMLGERFNVPQEQWQVLRRTGTNHLMAIGGLHIGMLALIIRSLVLRFWRRVTKLMLWMPAQDASAIAALMGAWIYSLQAGFSIPTQRASIMLTVFVLAYLQRRRINAYHCLTLAMVMVLLINPLTMMSESFWLSFGTIALIIFGMRGRLSPGGFWWQWGRVQWVIGIGLIPLTLMFFQECTFTTVLANSVAIPWLEFLILPFCLLSTLFVLVSHTLAQICLLIASTSLTGLWSILSWLASWLVFVWIQPIPSAAIFFIGLLGVVGLLLPPGIPGRWLAMIFLAYLFLFRAPSPVLGDVWFTLLDVGQGLSAVVQTKQHTLVFDAGPKLNAANDVGEQVVVPFLHYAGIHQLDMLVISHGDNDHFGGAQAILKAFPNSPIRTSVPHKFQQAANNCLAGQTWEWDGVKFTFLSPFSDMLGQGNNSSCVLLVEQENHSLLLTGDIEAAAERMLLQRYKIIHPVTILVAPHHGSKTSSTDDFVAAFRPRFVLYATGYLNRYHFPHQVIVDKYERIHTHQLNTAETGFIQFKLNKHVELMR